MMMKILLLTLLLAGCCLSAAASQSEEPIKRHLLFPQDCTQVRGQLRGVAVIQPRGAAAPFKVFCEVSQVGGWTVFQRRSGSSLSFDRLWEEFRNGFGEPGKDEWLGLQKVFSLTSDPATRWALRIDLWDHEGGSAFAEYSDFRLADESQAYALSVGQYRGTAGDAFRGAFPGVDQNGFGFSTADRDHDGCRPCIFDDIVVQECVRWQGAGWWFSSCGSASLNGAWHPRGQHLHQSSGLHWRTWKGRAEYSARASRMMVRPL